MSEEDRMRMELQRMQQRGDEITDDSLESTRRILRTAEETQDVGIKTLVMLDEQGEKLDRVDETLDNINADMREAEKNLTGMEKFCGLCICGCKRQKNFEKSEEYKKAYGKRDNDKQTNSKNANGGGGASGSNQGGYVQRISNDAREDEMDENLGQVSGIVGNLKAMAVDMGSELDTQNVKIERITDKATANDARINNANDRARQILKK